ncbi:MAG TPA: sigma-70 family RNA polymerase sigma factor [Polyangia bacterium]
MPLAETFLAHSRTAGQDFTPDDRLEASLSQALVEARQIWPGVRVDESLFLRQLARGIPAGIEPVEAISGVHVADLYLACGCLAGDSRALAALESHFLAKVSQQLGRTEGGAGPSEIIQDLRTRILLPREDGPARIDSYHGRGPLLGWLKVAAARVAMDQVRARRPENTHRDEGLQVRSQSLDPEMELLKRRYRKEFEEAFAETLNGLSPRDANVLRLYYLEGVSAQRIGAMYGVAARSIQLWIARSRRMILRRTRRLLADRLRLSTSQLEALTSLVQSQLDVSIHGLLKKAP